MGSRRSCVTALVVAAAAAAAGGLASCGGADAPSASADAGARAPAQEGIEWTLVGTRRGHAVLVRPRVPQRACENYRASLTETDDAVSIRMVRDASGCTGKASNRDEADGGGDRNPNPFGYGRFVALHLQDDLRGRTITGPAMAPLDAWQGGDSIGGSEEYPRAVPDLTGLSVAQARQLAAGYGSTVNVRAGVGAKAWVYRQWPRGGAADESSAATIQLVTTTQDEPPLDRRYGPLNYLMGR